MLRVKGPSSWKVLEQVPKMLALRKHAYRVPRQETCPKTGLIGVRGSALLVSSNIPHVLYLVFLTNRYYLVFRRLRGLFLFTPYRGVESLRYALVPTMPRQCLQLSTDIRPTSLLGLTCQHACGPETLKLPRPDRRPLCFSGMASHDYCWEFTWY